MSIMCLQASWRPCRAGIADPFCSCESRKLGSARWEVFPIILLKLCISHHHQGFSSPQKLSFLSPSASRGLAGFHGLTLVLSYQSCGLSGRGREAWHPMTLAHSHFPHELSLHPILLLSWTALSVPFLPGTAASRFMASLCEVLDSIKTPRTSNLQEPAKKENVESGMNHEFSNISISIWLP